MTQESVDTLFRNAHAVPQDKIEWTPGEGMRSVLDLCRECAQSPGFATQILTTRKVDFGVDTLEGDAWEEMEKETKAWKTIADCEQVARERTAKFVEAVNAFPEGDLEETIFLPFTDKDHPYWDIMGYPHWNNTWHTGQIAFIQKMLGDHEMH